MSDSAETPSAARAAGVALSGLRADRYCESDPRAGLVVGYAAAPDHTFDRAVEALASVLKALAWDLTGPEVRTPAR